MSNRFIKFLIIFLLIFSAQLIVLQFLLLRPQLAQAALPRIEPAAGQEAGQCPCSTQASSANQGVRLYIPIPWVTDGCGYVCDVNNDGQANVVDYIVSIYKFLVGLAAILAVIMIVWGGLLRIFSGGQANRIATSNDTIVSAVIGLVLSLVSVSLLQAINPALTNIELPSLTNIGRVSVSGIFATDEDIMLYEEKEIVAFNNQNLNRDMEMNNTLSQNSKLNPESFRGQNYNSKLKTDLISTAKAQDIIMPGTVDNLLRQEMAYEKGETPSDCAKDSKKMCFSLYSVNDLGDHLNGKLIKGSALKCNSTVDVKVAHINFKEDTNAVTGQKTKTNVIKSIECYHGLCDFAKNTHADDNQQAIIDFIKINYIQATWDISQNGCAAKKRSKDCIILSEGKDVGSAFAYGQDCSEIGSTGLCLVEFGKGMDAVSCVDIKSLCENTDAKACDDVNSQIHNEDLYGDKFAGMGCARRYDNWTKLIWAGDNCVFGPVLMCPPGWNRVSFNAGPAVNNQNTDKAEGVCWKMDNGQRAPKKVSSIGETAYILDNYQTAIQGANGICCEQDGRYQALGSFFSLAVGDVGSYKQIFNLKCDKNQCDQDAGKMTKDWISNGVKYKKGDEIKNPLTGKGYLEDKSSIGTECIDLPNVDTKGGIGGTHSKASICLNPQILKLCYHSTSNNERYYKYSPVELEKCLDYDKNHICHGYLVPKEFCCIGDVSGTDCGAVVPVGGGGGGSGSNPLVDLQEKYNTDPIFTAGAEKLAESTPLITKTQDAEAILRALAITESGGNPAEDSGKGYYGLMQISPAEVKTYSQSPISVAIPANPDPDADWIKTHPAESIQIAANYVVDMLNNPATICPVKYTPPLGMSERTCDYINDNVGNFYSQCQDAINSGSLSEKLKYIYAAYNGGAGANCHNETNFNSSPPCKDKGSICPLYNEEPPKGSIWECDAGDGYKQTRGGALRMVDCFKQFQTNLNTPELTGCCSAGQESCLTSCPAG